MKVTNRKGETLTVNTFADYITQEAQEQRDLLWSIVPDTRFGLKFDTGVGYIAYAFPVDEIEFCFNQNPDTGKYVAYLINHANENYLDFVIENLDATKKSIVESINKAYEYLELEDF